MTAAALVRVGEIAEQVRGVTFGKGDAIDFPDKGYLPVLRAGNITDVGVVFDDLLYVPDSKVTKKQFLRAGDVLIAASSGSLDVVGKAAPVLSDYSGAFGAFCKVLRPDTERVDAKYFSHFFKTTEYRRTVSSLAAGANINNLRNEHLDDLLMPLPPLPEQRRIAAILNKADALRTKRREALAQLDRLAQAIFVDMFGDPATNPKEWPMHSFGNIGLNEDSKRIPVKSSDRDGKQGQYPYYGASGIIDWVDDFIFDGDRLLIGEDGANLLARSTPVAFMAHGKFWVNNHAHVIAYNGKANLRFLEFLIEHIDLEPYISGSAQPKLNRSNLDRLPVMLPPISLQNEFAVRLAAVHSARAKATESQFSTDSLFASLQHSAFRGEL